jgi:hypothetical protein
VCWFTVSLSSKLPRYCVPATSEPTSSATTERPARPAGTAGEATSCATPSATAVLPTPASPMRMGLFLVRRRSTWGVGRGASEAVIEALTQPVDNRKHAATDFKLGLWLRHGL